MNVLILKMGGTGSRFGSDIPKQFHEFNGKPLFTHVLREYEEIGVIDKYIIVCHKDWIDYTIPFSAECVGDKLLAVIPGGDTGAKSIKNGIMYIKDYADDNDIILLHDATNPVIVKDKIPEIIQSAFVYGFATLGLEQVHAIYEKSDDNFAMRTLNKNTVTSGYSPEAFLFKYIYECYSTATDDELETATSAIALARWHHATAKIIIGNFINLKITYKDDLDAFRKLYKK